MARVRVVYDGLLATITQRREEILSVNGETLLGLLLKLGKTYGDRFQQTLFEPDSQNIRPEIAALVNGQRGETQSKLKDGDEVVLLIPFAGG